MATSKANLDLERALRAQGFTIEHGSKHRKVYAPDGRFIVVLSRSSGKSIRRRGCAGRNLLATLKRAGFKP